MLTWENWCWRSVRPFSIFEKYFEFEDLPWMLFESSSLFCFLICFCGMVDWRKAFSLISNRDHCQRPSPTRISDTPRTGFEPAQNLSSDLVEWSCAVVVTTTPRRHYLEVKWLFLYSFVRVWGWSDFVPSNFDLLVFNMADSLSRNIYRRNALRTNFQKTLEEARGYISDTRATQAKYLGLQNNIKRL